MVSALSVQSSVGSNSSAFIAVAAPPGASVVKEGSSAAECMAATRPSGAIDASAFLPSSSASHGGDAPSSMGTALHALVNGMGGTVRPSPAPEGLLLVGTRPSKLFDRLQPEVSQFAKILVCAVD